MTTIADLERLATQYGFVPQTVLEDWRRQTRSDKERDAATIAVLRGIMAYAKRNRKANAR